MLRSRGLLLSVDDDSTLKRVSREGCLLVLLLGPDETSTVFDLAESKEDIQREERPERVW